MHASLKSASFERAYVGRRQSKPFTVRSPFRESAVPVSLDTGRIIRPNGMLERNRLRQGRGDLLDTLFKLFAASDLVVASGLQKVYPAVSGVRCFMMRRSRVGQMGGQFGEVVVPGPSSQRGNEPVLVPEVFSERCVSGKSWRLARIHADFYLGGNPPKMADGFCILA